MLRTWPESVAIPVALPIPVSCAWPPELIVQVVEPMSGVLCTQVPTAVQLAAIATRTTLERVSEAPVDVANAWNGATASAAEGGEDRRQRVARRQSHAPQT
jgi:hypothetical protein